jgi:hypothetical protein
VAGVGNGNGTEASSVAIARLVCLLVMSLAILIGGALVVLSRPEYIAGVSLAMGVVMGAWFTATPRLRR